MNLDILIVENDNNDIEMYLDTIATLNKDYAGDVELKPVVKKTKEEGLSALNDRNWSAAFIDLKLSTGDILNADEGNEIVREIYQKRRFPVFILTNTPADVSEEFIQSSFLTINSKDGLDFREVFKNIIKISKTGIFNILGRKGMIEHYLGEIFWNHLSNSMDSWIDDESLTPKEKERSLLRYTLSHLQEYLEIDADSGEFLYYESTEFLVTPRVKKYAYTGEIVKKKDTKELFIILTPACDLAQAKAKDILLARIETEEEQGALQNLITECKVKPSTGGEKEKVHESEMKLWDVVGNKWPKYYFVPKSKVTPHSVINFQKLISVRYRTFYDDYDSLGVVSSHFLKDIIAKFSFYYSRQGAPDFNSGKIIASLLS